MKFVEISNGVLHASIAADGSQFTVGSDRISYRAGSDWAAILYGPYINLNLPRNGRVTAKISNGELHIQIDRLVWNARFPGHGFRKPDPGPDMTFGFRVRLEGDEAVFTAEVPRGLDDEVLNLEFPGRALNWDTGRSGQLVSAFRSHGVIFNFPSPEKGEWETEEFLPLAGWFDPRGGIGVSCDEMWDHVQGIRVNRPAGTGSCYFRHEFVRGKSEYVRHIRMKFFPPGSGYTDLAKWYRATVKRTGRFVSLREKAAAAPEVGRLAGTVLWKHNVYYQSVPPAGVRRDWSFYVFSPERAEPEGKVANWTAKEIFDTARAGGFDRVCVLNTGWNCTGYDNGFPKRLPVNPERGTAEEFRKAAEYGRSLSPDYICSVHDNYRDLYSYSPEFDPADLVYTGDGIPLKGGIWHGGRCHIGCCAATLKYAERDLPRIAALAGRGAIYIDVLGHSNLQNCFNPRHPGSRRDDAERRIEILRLAKRYFGAVATEGAPFDWAVADTDIGAFAQVKVYDIWNAQAIPLFQLIYHDAIYGYISCDLCGAAGTEYSNYVALYGMLPYGFDRASYRISTGLRETCFAEMLDHEVLDTGVERTTFGDGTVVTVNNTTAAAENVPPGDFRIERR